MLNSKIEIKVILILISAADDTKVLVDGNPRKVVLKKFSYQFDVAEQAKRVFREVKLLKHVNHYNIIGLYDLFTDSQSFDNIQHV